MTCGFRRAAAAGLAALFLCLTGCSGDKPPTAPAGNDSEVLKQDADRQKQMHDKMRHNK